MDLLAGLDIYAPTIPLCSTPHTKAIPEAALSAGNSDFKPGAATSALIIPPIPHSAAEEGRRGGVNKSLTEKDVERLRADAEKLEHLVSGLTSRSLQGTVPLDTKWRDLLRLAEQSGKLAHLW